MACITVLCTKWVYAGGQNKNKTKTKQNKTKQKQKQNKTKQTNKKKKNSARGIRYYEHITKPFRTYYHDYGIVRGEVQKKVSNQVVGCIRNDLKML